MEAAALPQRRARGELSGDKAARIVEAMRLSVAARGIAGSTFDHVAREAGVSRVLLHYYFGTKERLLVEVVRRESEVRAVITFYELFTLGQRNDEIAVELAGLAQRTRERLAGALRAGQQAGVFELPAPAGDVASFLFALADGVTIRRLCEPARDVKPLMDQAVAAARALLA
jgi:AcrR family transcriptional regulator